MRVRACWILLAGAGLESLAGLSWLVRGDQFSANAGAVCAAAHLAYFLLVEHREPAEGWRLWE